eukprot:6189518-Pleurochrysis_carterae.AAC.1
MFAARQTRYYTDSFNERVVNTSKKLKETSFFKANASVKPNMLAYLVTLFIYQSGKTVVYDRFVPFIFFSKAREQAKEVIQHFFDDYRASVTITPELLGI